MKRPANCSALFDRHQMSRASRRVKSGHPVSASQSNEALQQRYLDHRSFEALRKNALTGKFPFLETVIVLPKILSLHYPLECESYLALE